MLVAAGAGELAPASATASSTSAGNGQGRRDRRCRPGGCRGDLGEESGRGRCRAPGRGRGRGSGVRPGGGKRERGQDRERGHLDHAGHDARGGADLFESEQPDPDRQQVAAEGGQREDGSRRGRQPARDDVPAAGHQHGQREGEGGDDLQQEQPADGRNRPVAGQVQVQVDRPGGDQQAGARDPQQERRPAGSRRSGVPLSGSRCGHRCLPGRGFSPCHRVSPFCRGAGVPGLGCRPGQ